MQSLFYIPSWRIKGGGGGGDGGDVEVPVETWPGEDLGTDRDVRVLPLLMIRGILLVSSDNLWKIYY